MNDPSSRHVTIIGAGVIGLSCAHALLRRGFAVTVVEQGAPQHDCCSLGNAGMVVPSHVVPLAAPGMMAKGLRWMWNPQSPFAIRPRPDPALARWGWLFYRSSRPERSRRAMPVLRDLGLASRREFLALRDELENFGLETRGLLMLYRTAKAEEEEAAAAEAAVELGLDARVLTARQLAELDPDLELDVRGGVLFPQDCHLDPAAFVGALSRSVQESGGEIRWSTPIEDCAVRGGAITRLHTARGDLAVDEVVLAGGVWSGRLARRFGLRLPLQAGKGYSLTLDRPRQLPRLCSILCEAKVAVTPIGHRLRFGGTMEIGAMNQRVDTRRVRGIVHSIPAYLPAFRTADFHGQPVWTGLRPCSPDGLPYIGRVSGVPNLTVAAGHAMLGLSLAPVTGRLVAELLAGETPSIDLAPLAPDRYA